MGSDNPYHSLRLSSHIQIGPFWLAVLTVLLGLVLRFLIDHWLGDQMPYITFLVSVAVTGLYAGVRPALLSTALGAALAYFCFVPPRYHWGFAGMSDAVGFLSYLAAALGIVVLTRARNKAHEETTHSARPN
jgi:K+-sensing histidine kinase KdpD